jgi:hypothetical protein
MMDFHRQARPLWVLLKLLIQPSWASRDLKVLDTLAQGERSLTESQAEGVSYRVGDRG